MISPSTSEEASIQWIAAILPEADLRDRGWRYVARHGRLMEAPSGARLFGSGDPCADFVFVLNGSIRVQYVGEDGHEIVLYRVQKGETCVLTTACLLGDTSYPAEGIAETDLQVALLSRAAFREALAYESFRDYVFAVMSRRITDLMLLIDEVAFRRMDKRLARWLTERGGSVMSTHQEIAIELGSAREVISRLLKEFERRGWVALGRRRVEILQRDALADFGCD